MNEDKHKIKIGSRGKDIGSLRSNYIKPSGKFWKRFFNKKVRKGDKHKRGNWFSWC